MALDQSAPGHGEDRPMSARRPIDNTHGVDAIFLNGTVGVGKSTVAGALSDLEPAIHAVIDLDSIRRLSPAPESDRFNHELELANLHSLSLNYRRAGAVRFILAGVIEEPAEAARYVDALGTQSMFICRLTATGEVVAGRLARRHRDDPQGLAWHRARAIELDRILSDNAGENLLLDSTSASPRELAVCVRHAAGWDE
jgi:predicted kinase